MRRVVWYISKYTAPRQHARVGVRAHSILSEMARTGVETVLITSDANHLANVPALRGRVQDEVHDGVHVRWIRTMKYGTARTVRRIMSWFDFELRVALFGSRNLPRPDVIIASSLSLLTVLTGLYLRRKFPGCKLVFEVRDVWPMILVKTGGFSPRNPAIWFLAQVERLGYRHADLIVSTLPNLAEHVREVLGEPRSVVCIPQGIDLKEQQNPANLPAAYVEQHVPNGKFIVCHAGSIGADNALETLLACARAMVDEPDVHFLVVGEGYLKATLQAQVADLSNITFAPAVPRNCVQDLLSHVDVVYFAAHRSPVLRFGQSLNKIVDYMYAGKPIIGSYTGFPSMINEAGCGEFVPAEDVQALADAIRRFKAIDAAHRAEMGRRGREWIIQHRSFEALAQVYLAEIERLTPEARAGH
jgi:glycosyltransferase involved in cell wall biosynthesis